MGHGGVKQLRRPYRADRGDAPISRGGKALDQRESVSARSELLHAAARAGSAAVGDIHRMAPAQDLGWDRRRHLVRDPRLHLPARLEHLVHRVPRGNACPIHILRAQTGGACNRGRGRFADREEGPEDAHHGSDRRARVCCDLFLRHPVPHDHPLGRSPRLRRRPVSTAGVRCRQPCISGCGSM